MLPKGEGEEEPVSVESFIETRPGSEPPGEIDHNGPPSEECNLPDLGCTAPERAEQSESVNYTQNEMCNIDPAALEYPVTLYLVKL